MGQLNSEPTDFDLLSAALRADGSDNDTFFQVLSEKLYSALGERVSLSREGGFRKREHPVRSITVDLGDVVLVATKEKGRIACVARKSVRGIVLRTDQLDFDSWLATLAGALAEEAKRSATTRAALESLLT
ncbi:MAG: hypothetical protein ACRDY2_05340 [Acidimicrobiales bacterium]